MLYCPKLPDGASLTGVTAGDNYSKRLSRHYSRVATRLGRQKQPIGHHPSFAQFWAQEVAAAQALLCTKTGNVA
jgi:hypothetical protein